jgi:restriction system protein
MNTLSLTAQLAQCWMTTKLTDDRGNMPDKSGFPTFDELMWPTLEAIKALGGSGTNEEILDKVAVIQRYPVSLLNEPHKTGSVSKLEYRAAWARTYLKFTGSIENSARGVWSITKFGESVKHNDIGQLVKIAREAQKSKTPKTVSATSESDEVSVDDLELSWKEQLLAEMQRIDPTDFEKLCQRLLRESGFIRVEVTGKTGDGGIDGTGVLRMNLLSFHVLFQCKRIKGSVGSSVVRDFHGAMVGRADKGLIITTGNFTSEARKEAARDGAPAIDLIDGHDLCDLLKSLRLGVSVSTIESVAVDRNWFANL